jgi:FAD/FMN-containing dehydrogenase
VVPVWSGDLGRGAEVLRPLRETVRPLFDIAGPMPYVALQSMLDEGSQPGMRNRWAAEFVPELTPGLVAALQDAIVDCPSPMAQIIVTPLPEAVRRVSDDATAFPGRSGGRWLVHPVGVWADPADDEANVAWVRALTSVVREYGVTGSYLNLEESDDDRVRWVMGERRYQRLQRVKAAWDPDDVFRHCAHVRTPDASRG